MKNRGWYIAGILSLLPMLFSGCGTGDRTLADISAEQESIQASVGRETVSESQDREEPASEEADERSLEEKMKERFQAVKLTESYKGGDATNPLISQDFGADPYAMVYDGRLYIYMTADAFEYENGEVSTNTYSKINRIKVISTVDMVNFTDHGYIQVAGKNGAAKWANNSWAPAAAWKNIDGQDKFFLYFADGGGGIGVVTADSPVGPFTDPIGKGLIRRDMPNCGNVLWLFDPAVLVDDDGRAYIYFGGGVPEGKVAAPGTGRCAELTDDMIGLKGEAIAIDIPYLFEDSGIHKYNNKYYYTYCTNWQVDEAGEKEFGIHNAEIACMESDSPLGPFTFKEVILENPGRVFGLYGNNHHCVFSYQDRWYITYHARTVEKAMGIEKGYRSTHIDPFTMGEDGTIGKIQMNLRGREQIAAVDPYTTVTASTFAREGGIACKALAELGLEGKPGVTAVTDIQDGDFIRVQGVSFGETSPKSVRIKLAGTPSGDAAIKICTAGKGAKTLGYLEVSGDLGTGTVLEAELLEEVTGEADVMFVFAGENYHMIDWTFVK